MLFERLKWFRADESDYRGHSPAWRESNKMSGFTLLLLDQIRDITAWPIIIHAGFGKEGHTAKTWHERDDIGHAVDYHFKTQVPFAVQIETVLQIIDEMQVNDLIGLGIYPEWNNPGFHLDDRGFRARWGKLGGKFVSFNEARTAAYTIP